MNPWAVPLSTRASLRPDPTVCQTAQPNLGRLMPFLRRSMPLVAAALLLSGKVVPYRRLDRRRTRFGNFRPLAARAFPRASSIEMAPRLARANNFRR